MPYLTRTQPLQRTHALGGNDDRRVIAPSYLAVIQRSAFRDEGSLFDCPRARPARASPATRPHPTQPKAKTMETMPYLTGTQPLQRTHALGGDDDRRVIAPSYLAVIQRSFLAAKDLSSIPRAPGPPARPGRTQPPKKMQEGARQNRNNPPASTSSPAAELKLHPWSIVVARSRCRGRSSSRSPRRK